MNSEFTSQSQTEHFSATFYNSWLLLFLILIPLSCTAQRNALNLISSTERSDGKGHVIRFHLGEDSSFDFVQPHPRWVQLELRGSDIDTAAIRINDQSSVIEDTDYYRIDNGIGIDIFLRENGSYYRAAAYPDRTSRDILVGLTRTSRTDLTAHIKGTEAFAWSEARMRKADLTNDESDGSPEAVIDTSYQKIKDKIRFDTVVLDAGHGGPDVGTNHNGSYEKNIVLDITKKVGNYINKYLPEVNVVYTRSDDYLVGAKENPNISIMESLVKRGQIANQAEGDLFVSIHANAVPSAPSAHGTETYFLGLERSESALNVMKRENKLVGTGESIEDELSQEELAVYELANSGYIANSQKLASMVENQFKNRAQRHSRGVKQARFVVLYHASMPAILIETGFLSNPSEADYLASEYGQSIIASAIFRAIRNYKEDFEKSQHLNTN